MRADVLLGLTGVVSSDVSAPADGSFDVTRIGVRSFELTGRMCRDATTPQAAAKHRARRLVLTVSLMLAVMPTLSAAWNATGDTPPAQGAPTVVAPTTPPSQGLWSEFVKLASPILNGRQVIDVSEAGGTKGGTGPDMRAAYRQIKLAVPLVIAQDGMGSSAVVRVAVNRRTAWIITNEHVVNQPIRQCGKNCVFLVFYTDALLGSPFQVDLLTSCGSNPNTKDLCKALKQVLRRAEVVRTDKRRDLALVRVDDPPDGVQAITVAPLDDLEMGDEVEFVGHPEGYLWSLSAGRVSQVRPKFPLVENAEGVTIIQTDSAINRGNSGGPLLTPAPELHLLGIAEGGALQGGTGGVGVPAPGLNLAIAVSEVQSFLAENESALKSQ
jgi:S1-C subfamily serine protease